MSIIKVLKNPMSMRYRELKNFLLNDPISWMFHESTVNADQKEKGILSVPQGMKDLSYFDLGTDSRFFSHPFLLRSTRDIPYSYLPGVEDKHFEKQTLQLVLEASRDILEANGHTLGCAYRASANLLIGEGEESWSPAHIDHIFPHKNLLIYLTSPTKGGTLRVFEDKYAPDNYDPKFEKYEEFTPREDDAVIFDGEHYHSSMPSLIKGEKRICVIVTFIEANVKF